MGSIAGEGRVRGRWGRVELFFFYNHLVSILCAHTRELIFKSTVWGGACVWTGYWVPETVSPARGMLGDIKFAK